MNIADLYGEIYPELKSKLKGDALDVSGQFFIRDAGSGLVMVIGVAQMPVPPIETETIYVGIVTKHIRRRRANRRFPALVRSAQFA